MKKRITLFLVMLCCIITNSRAQASGSTQMKATFNYYLFFAGVNTKADVVNIERNLQSRGGVSGCKAEKFPVRYFLVSSARALSLGQLSAWIDTKQYRIEFFGEGALAKEQLLVNRQKTIH